MNAENKERKQAEKALQESKERFRGFAEAAFEGIGIAERGKIIDANQQLAQMLGYDVAELMGMDVMACVAPASRALVQEHSIAEFDKPYEHLALRKDGTTFPVEARGKTVIYQGRSVRVAAIRDITERKHAEETLRESEQRFRELFESSPDAIFVEDLEGYVRDANPAACRLHDAACDQLVGMHILDLVLPDEREHVKQKHADLVAGALSHFEGYSWTMDKRAVPVEVRASRITYAGQPALLLHVRDVTGRKQAEEALRESEERFSKVFFASPVAIVLSEIDRGQIIDVNDSFLHIFGFSREEVIGRSVLELGIWQDERVREQIVARLQRHEKIDEFEIRFATKSEAVRDVRGAVEMIELKGRVCLLWMGVDVTERKQAEQELVAAKEKAEEMNRLKSIFLANMSHEFRTPLAGIIGFAEILATEVPEGQQEYVHLIDLSGRRLLDTLSSVLDLAMLEAGGLKLDPEVLNVAEEVQKKADVLYLDARSKGLHLQTLLPSAKVEALLDRAYLDRILHHLVGNAIKFTEHGEIIVAVYAVDERVEIEVRDTGIGIGPAFLPHLFEAFKQESTGTARTYEGAGLGLTITKRLVELMDGEITMESQKGSGSVFTVSFPCRVMPPPAVQEKQDRELRPPVERSPVRGRVLALDDNPAMLHLLERFLEEIPEVSAFDTAKDDEEALALARKHRYDVVLTDINLGSARTGEDVLQDLRRMPEYAEVPVVAVTAYVMPEDRARFLEAGFDAYLGKPFSEEQLRDLLLEVLPTPEGHRPHPPATKTR